MYWNQCGYSHTVKWATQGLTEAILDIVNYCKSTAVKNRVVRKLCIHCSRKQTVH